MDCLARHYELRQSFTLPAPLKTMGSDVKIFRWSSWPDLAVELPDDHLVEAVIFLVESPQLYAIGFDVFVVVVGCWSVCDERSQSWCFLVSMSPMTSWFALSNPGMA